MTHIALTIAGSDSGGGAGIQADIKTFQMHGVFATSAITCITAQNPDGVAAIQEISAEIVGQQIRSVLQYFQPQAIKTGMLFSAAIIEQVVSELAQKTCPLVIDPVMVATSGARLLQEDAIEKIQQELIPLADLITPNVDEAEVLLQEKITDSQGLEDACRALYTTYHIPVLLKGGHRHDHQNTLDYLYDGNTMTCISKPYLTHINTHGSGCTYSSAIAAQLACGQQQQQAVQKARNYLQKTFENGLAINQQIFINHNGDPV